MLMKKLFLILAAAAVTMWSCQKPAVTPTDEGGKQGGEEQNPDPKPEVKDEITLISDAVVNLPTKDSQQFTVKFTTNAAWTAEADEFITLQKTSGEAGENIEVMAVVQSLGDEEYGRVGGILIKAGKAEASVGIMQGLVFLVDPQKSEIGIEGGKVEFQVISNQEYTVKTYDAADAAFPWAPVTFDQETGMGSLAVEPNGGYDARTAYIKFTVPGIQVPALDDEGNPTGETEDYVTRFYVYQAGNSKTAWNIALPQGFDVTNVEADYTHYPTASIALFGDKVLVSDGTTLYAFDKASGAASTITVPSGLPVQSITNDDAGNVLFANEGFTGSNVEIYAVRADASDLSGFVKVAEAANGVWCAATADCVKAKGDVFGNAVISVLIGGGTGFGNPSYAMVWQVTAGVADGSKYVVGPTDYSDTIWISNRGSFAPAGDTDAAGYFYCGYDGVYALNYFNGTEWSHAVEGLGDWSMAPNAIASTVWNGKAIVAVNSMAYWGLDWSMPSILHVFDMTGGEILAQTEYVAAEESVVTGGQEASTTDVVLKVEGNDLAAYVVDSDWGLVTKIVYPKL